MHGSDETFRGSIPELYDSALVPMFFEPYAADMAKRLAARSVERILEVAAGTGVVTRSLAAVLPEHVAIVATDLNQPMLDRAAAIGTARPVEWRQADAMHLPFPDASFDAVVCQFGVMFFPDRPKAFSEVRRVLRSGGVFLFNVWDRLEENELSHTVSTALATLFPEDPPRFFARTPHGYHETSRIESDLLEGGFTARPDVVAIEARSLASSPLAAAVAICQGTPLRNEIEARGVSRLEEATEVANEAIARRFGRGPVDGKTRAKVVVVEG